MQPLLSSIPVPVILAAFLSVAVLAQAADYYVDNVKGSDQADGLSAQPGSSPSGPLATINAAIALARPGDTIRLIPTGQEYRQNATFKDKSGSPGSPITLDGAGVTLSGADPCPSTEWQKLPSGVWMRPATLSRNILVVDDAIILEKSMVASLQPGQFCFEFGQFNVPTIYFQPPAGRSVRDCRVEVVTASGEIVLLDSALWKGGVPRYTFKGKDRPARILLDGAEAPLLAAKDHLQPGEWCNAEGTLYFLPPQGKTPADLRIALAVREYGIGLGGTSSHLVVRNFNVRYVWNDAYNVHGSVKDATFLNCNASDCFDEGFSAHDKCETVLDGATYLRCDNGVMNVNTAGYSITRNLVVRESRHKGFGVAVLNGEARHELYDAVLIDNPTPLSGRYLTAKNILIVQTPGAPASEIELVAPVQLSDASILGQNTLVRFGTGSGDIRLENTVISSSGEGTQTLEADDGQKLHLDTLWLRPGTPFFLVKNRKKSPQPLAAWLDALTQAGDARQINLLAPSGISPDQIRKGGILPPGAGCSPSLWITLSP